MKKRAPTALWTVGLVVSLLILPATPMLKAPTAAAQSVVQAQQITLPPGTLRTVDEMLVDQATAVFPASSGGEVVFRPGGDPAEYMAAKAAAAAARQGRKPVAPAPDPAGAVAKSTMNCDGSDQITSADVDGRLWRPPDADGAVGVSQFVQTTNMHVTVWSKTPIDGCPDPLTNPQLDVDLQTFMGYLPPVYPNANRLFDARVVHDDLRSRWIITAIGFAEGGAGTPQVQFIAVSQSEDATDDYFIYSFNTRTLLNCPTCFWDYPQLGYDGTAIILTANIFDGSPLVFDHTRLVFINKSDLYAGFGPLVCTFISDAPSWAPPKVVGASVFTWLAEAPFPGRGTVSSLKLLKFSSTGDVCPDVVGAFSISIGKPGYAIPPDARQPDTTTKLDSLDGRFQNRSAQVGDNYLWQTHTGGYGAFPIPDLFRIRLSGAGSPVVEQRIFFFRSLSSDDWNPSIAANSANTVALNWSATDAALGVNAEVRVGAKTFAATGVSQALVFGSSVPYVGFGRAVERWGDYSSTVIDPTNGGIAWGVNEEIDNPDDISGVTWGTRYFNATVP